MEFRRTGTWAAAVALTLGLAAADAVAQQHAPPAPESAPPPAIAPADVAFSRVELENLLKPIALYPDALLAQMLPAAAYPLDIVQAARWLDRNHDAVARKDFSGADAQGWDVTVAALVRFPDIIGMMNQDLKWTSDLGDAFVRQPQDVADVIQALRLEAERIGSLRTTPQQNVVRRMEDNREVILIEPAQPGVIYVPQYNPVQVYDPMLGTAVVSGLIGFGAGVLVGSLWNNNNYWNWRSGYVYPPVWGGYPGHRPGYPGYRPGYPGYRPPGGNINIGNDVNIGNQTSPWRPNPDRYRPGMGTKPALARPGGLDRPGVGGAGLMPGAVARPGAGVSGTSPGGFGRPGGGNAGMRPGGWDRPGAANRPDFGAQSRPQRPATRPAQRPGSSMGAYGGANFGKGSAAYGHRGTPGRAVKAQRPIGGAGMRQGGGRPAKVHPAGGGRHGGGRAGGGGRGGRGGQGR